MSDVQKQIFADLKEAMKNRDSVKSTILRGIMAKFKDAEIARPDGRRALTPDEAMGVLRKMVKPCQESLEMFLKADRQDAVEKARAEIAIIESYLPQAPKPEEIQAFVTEAVKSIEAPSMKDMGSLMAQLKERFGAALDSAIAGPMVKSALTAK